jgi:catechol 2,3-dioxygenase-like lactoylglutathione lyase family enzyme
MCGVAAAPAEEELVELEALDHVGLAVSDVDRSIDWYQRVLGLERAFEEVWGSYPAVLVRGGSGVALFPARGAAIVPDTFDSLAHVGFRTSAAGFGQARAELAAAGIEFRESDHKAARSLYLLDPDRHLVEITTYDVGPDYSDAAAAGSAP